MKLKIFLKMPRCLEYGVILPRLQWTHFRYKCTGRFQNGLEYLAVYPDAILVDPELAKRTAVTLENLILKYGQEEGKSRWERYKQRQAESNSFEYKQKKYGWTEEEVKLFNQSRATTIENLVKRHGKEIGLAIWQQYCDRQAYTNTLDYFIEREGSSKAGLKKYEEVNKEKSNPHNTEWLAEHYNITIEEALELRAKRGNAYFVSNGEKNFVDRLEIALGENLPYTYKTKQFCVWSEELHKPFFYDIVDTKRMKAVEYNGDYYHASPNKYVAEDVIHEIGKTAKQIWNEDLIKLQTIKDRGFEVLVVWESKLDAEEVINWLKK